MEEENTAKVPSAFAFVYEAEKQPHLQKGRGKTTVLKVTGKKLLVSDSRFNKNRNVCFRVLSYKEVKKNQKE